MVTQDELLAALKELVIETAKHTGTAETELSELRARVESSVTTESPLREVGWDSVHMTWILVRVEERFDIDTSNLSLFDMFTVGDLTRELQALIEAKSRQDG